jgi:hypothetical protein
MALERARDGGCNYVKINTIGAVLSEVRQKQDEIQKITKCSLK